MLHIENIFEKNTMARERGDKRFTVAWDMDNTLVDEFGGKTRPGVVEALQRLREKNVKLVVWTNSRGQRALDIMRARRLEQFFHALISRESYMLDEFEKNKPDFHKKIAAAFPREAEFQKKFESGKNVSLLGYGVLVDDNPQVRSEAAFWGGAYRVEVCERFTGGKTLANPGQIDLIADRIAKLARPSLWRRIGFAK
jgi:hypothetical protein